MLSRCDAVVLLRETNRELRDYNDETVRQQNQ